MLNFDEPFIRGNFYNLFFFKSSDLGVKKFFYPLNTDPDPGSQNLADPKDLDPDPNHWVLLVNKKIFLSSQLGPLAISNT